MFKKKAKKSLRVTYKHEREEVGYTEVMTTEELANLEINDPYFEVLKVEEV